MAQYPGAVVARVSD